MHFTLSCAIMFAHNAQSVGTRVFAQKRKVGMRSETSVPFECVDATALQMHTPCRKQNHTYSHGCAHAHNASPRTTCMGARTYARTAMPMKGTDSLQHTFRNIPGPQRGVPTRADEQAAAHLHQSAHCVRVPVKFSDTHACAVGCTAANCARHLRNLCWCR